MNTTKAMSDMMDNGRNKDKKVDWAMHPASGLPVCLKYYIIQDNLEVSTNQETHRQSNGETYFYYIWQTCQWRFIYGNFTEYVQRGVFIISILVVMNSCDVDICEMITS